VAGTTRVPTNTLVSVVNDCVYAINTLLPFYHKILYIDLDIHHGDGVESTFLDHRNVLTFSAHKFSPGFYPCTGGETNLQDQATEFENQYVNLTFPENLPGSDWADLVIAKYEEVLAKCQGCFDAIVLVCGADCLKFDPLGDGFQVELKDYIRVVDTILSTRLPTLMLGGGGYNPASTARLWTCLTLLALEPGSKILNKLPNTIPSSYVIDHYDKYAPSYCLGELDKCPEMPRSP